jgi:hypothetical protein
VLESRIRNFLVRTSVLVGALELLSLPRMCKCGARDVDVAEEEACQKFEAVMAVCAIVGLVAITCVFVVAGAFVDTKSDSATIFQRRLETYKALRGVSEDFGDIRNVRRVVGVRAGRSRRGFEF